MIVDYTRSDGRVVRKVAKKLAICSTWACSPKLVVAKATIIEQKKELMNRLKTGWVIVQPIVHDSHYYMRQPIFRIFSYLRAIYVDKKEAKLRNYYLGDLFGDLK